MRLRLVEHHSDPIPDLIPYPSDFFDRFALGVFKLPVLGLHKTGRADAFRSASHGDHPVGLIQDLHRQGLGFGFADVYPHLTHDLYRLGVNGAGRLRAR